MGLTIQDCHRCGEYRYLPDGTICRSCGGLEVVIACQDCGAEYENIFELDEDEDGLWICTECKNWQFDRDE